MELRLGPLAAHGEATPVLDRDTHEDVDEAALAGGGAMDAVLAHERALRLGPRHVQHLALKAIGEVLERLDGQAAVDGLPAVVAVHLLRVRLGGRRLRVRLGGELGRRVERTIKIAMLTRCQVDCCVSPCM